MIHFNSDYLEGAHPKVLQALIDTNMVQTVGYGEDAYCARAREKIKAALQAPQADVHFLVGGTQTNTTVIASVLRPYQGVLSAVSGHINCHETGAIESTGHKVIALPTSDGKITAADRKVIGNAAPDFTGGISLSAYYKGIDFSANFNYMIGNDVYNANKVEFTSSRKYYNRNLIDMMNVDNRWTNIDWATGEIITDAATLNAVNAGKTMWNPAIGNAVFSSWAVEDASFLRLQSVTIGYTLPESLTEKIWLNKVRVYVTGTNLFCLTGYSGYDPEVDTRRSTPLTPGVDYSAYPKSIGFVAGVNVTFGKRSK